MHLFQIRLASRCPRDELVERNAGPEIFAADEAVTRLARGSYTVVR